MDESWMVFRGLPEDEAFVVKRIDLSFQDDEEGRSARPRCVELAMRYEPDEHGMPTRDARQAIDDFEDRIVAMNEGDDGEPALVGRETGRGLSRLVFYGDVGRAAAFVERATRALAEDTEAPPADVRSFDDAEWDTYSELMPTPPELRLANDELVIAAAEDAGDELETIRPTEHFAYFETKEQGERYAEAAQREGYSLAAIEQAEGMGEGEDSEQGESSPTFWCVELVRELPIVIDEIFAVTCELSELAEEYGGEYDGWQTPLVKDGKLVTGEDD